MPSENHDDYEVELEITSPQQDKINQLKELFPEIIQDGAVNVGVLKDILGEGNIVGDTTQPNTKYGLYWYGKNKAKEIANKSTRNTLVPQKGLSVNFEDTENLLIEGDNLEVLKILQRTHMGKVDVIYIDPPYNTGNDFVYEDDFNNPIHAYLEQTGQLNDEGKKTSSDSETSGRKHANWLNMMYPRLKVARGLLSNDGVIFISIDDNEVSQLKIICDEIFGEDNFVNSFIWLNNLKGRQISNFGAAKTYETILCYCKDSSKIETFEASIEFLKSNMPSSYKGFNYDVLKDEIGEYVIKNELYNTNSVFNEVTRPNLVFNIHYNPIDKTVKFSNIDKDEVFPNYVKIEPKLNNNKTHKYHAWRWSQKKIINEIHDLEFVPNGNTYRIYTKIRNHDITAIKDIITDIGNGNSELKALDMPNNAFSFPKPTLLIKLFLISINKKDAIVLDFFAGSGTTGHAVLDLNTTDGGKRNFILIQIPEKIMDDKGKPIIIDSYGVKLETIADVTRERLLKYINKTNNSEAGFKIFKLAESNYTINRKIAETYDPNNPNLNSELLEQWKKELANPLVDGWRAIDVLYENMLREGYDLNSEVKPTNADGIAYDVVEELSDGTKRMLVCNLDKIDDAEVKRMEELVASGDYKKITFVCLDKYLTDTQKYNLGSLLTLKTI